MQLRLTWILAAVVATACGGSEGTSPSPTSPAGLSTASASGGTTTTKSDSSRTTTTLFAEGAVSALGGTCPKITFAVAGKTFTTDSLTRFENGGCAAVKNDVRVVVAYQSLTGGSVRVLAVKVIPPPPPPPTMTEGTVSALSGTCPKITFTVAGKNFTTDSLTRFSDGGCAAVKNDAKVLVQSQATTAGGVRVLAVKVIPPPPPPPTMTEGTVSALSGSCPKVTFTVAGKTFTTDSLTRFGDGGCAAVKNDVRVVVAYQSLTGGSVRVLAVKVIPPPPPPPPPTKGTVSALSGSCPKVTFTVAGKTFTTDSLTRFGDGGCAAVKNDVRVVVAYQSLTGGSVRVLAVKVIPPPPPPPTMTEGTVSALSGSCPKITFTVAGKTFTADSLTRFGDGGCAAVKNDVKVLVQSQATTAGGVRVLAVKVIPPPPPPPPPTMTEGTVSALSGNCPKVTFTVAGKTFTTDSLTRFSDGGCAAVKNDAKVLVQSQATTAGGVRVLAVKVIPPPPPPPTIAGEITALSGTCPAITISLGTKQAVTSAATVFSGKACADVRVGAKVAIYGTVAAGATIVTATKVVIR